MDIMKNLPSFYMYATYLNNADRKRAKSECWGLSTVNKSIKLAYINAYLYHIPSTAPQGY